MVQFPNTTSASGVWNMTDVYNNRLGGTWPSLPAIGFFGGGYTPTVTNVIQYINITSSGNAIDFGDLTQARGTGNSAVANTTRGIWQGGNASPVTSNVIDYITIASAGNATDFGDLTEAKTAVAQTSNSIKNFFGGGNAASLSNVLEKVTIATASNATDFGDLFTASYIQAVSNSNGGLT